MLLSIISNKINNNNEFLSTLKELVAEDIVSDYECRSTLLLSKKDLYADRVNISDL